MSTDSEGLPGTSAAAEAAFASFVARVDRGDDVDFEAFCAERDEYAAQLRSLHEAWVQSRRDRAPSIREFLESSPDARGSVSLDDDAPTGDTGSGVRERIEGLASCRGRYTLCDEVARGGMGVIIRVWDKDLRRTLAMKATFGDIGALAERDATPADLDQIARFLEEAQITGQLDHPGVVPVHELGVDSEGRMFFTMRLVRGRTLDQIIDLARDDRENWTRPRALGVIVRVCEALAFAHSKGVIHRDIKPANIMVGKFGEVYVMDWGLAKVIGDRPAPSSAELLTRVQTDRVEEGQRPESPMQTMEGTIMGTPAFMPPEQAEGRIDALDLRSDVYSVGALLYTLLTGHAPYVDPGRKQSLMDVLNALLERPPAPIAERDKDAPPELVAICEKAMARRPEDRYSAMLDLAKDLRAFTESRVVQAYEAGALAEFRKWVKRNRGMAAAVAALFVVLLGGSSLIAWQQRQKVTAIEAAGKRTEIARRNAETNATVAKRNAIKARDSAQRAERASYLANLAGAHANLRVFDTRQARDLLAGCPERFRGWEWNYLRSRTDTSSRVLRGHKGPVTAVAFAPDGSRVVSGGADGKVRVWDANTGDVVFVFDATAAVTAIDFGPDGSYVVAGSKDNLLRIWDVEGGRGLRGTLAGHESAVTSLAFHSNGRRILTGAEEDVRLWDIARFRELAVYAHESPVAAVAFSGERVVTGTADGVHVWENGKLVRTIECDDPVLSLASVGERIAAGLYDSRILVIEPAAGQTQKTLIGHADPVNAVAAAGGARIVSASHDRTVRLFDLKSGTAQAVLQGHNRAVMSVDFADGRIVSGSADGTVRLWDAKGSAAALALWGEDEFLSAVAFSPDGKHLAAASAGGGAIRIFETATGANTRQYTAPGALSSLVFSQDGRWLVAGGHGDATAHIYDLAGGGPARACRGHELSVTCVALTADGARLATGSADQAVRLWNPATGECVRILSGHKDRVTAVAFSNDGTILLSAAADGMAVMWRVADGSRVHEFRANEGEVHAAVFDPVRPHMLIAGADGLIRRFDAATGAAIGKPLAGHAGAVRSVAFNKTGTRIVSGGADKTMRIWDAENGGLLLSLVAHGQWVTSVAFAPDGKTIASASFDGFAKLWRAAR